MKILGSVTAVVLFMAVSIIINGYCFSVLWSWFISSTFGMDELAMSQAIGLAMVVGFLTYKDENGSDKKELMEKLIDGFSVVLSKAAMYLAIGFVVSRFL